MPGLVAFNRSWRVAADDLFLPGVIGTITETCFVIFVAVLMSLLREEHCPQHFTFTMWCNAFALGIHGLLIVNAMGMAFIASRGTPLDLYPRRHMHWMIYTRLILILAELGQLIAWSVLVSRDWGACVQVDYYLVIALMSVGWAFNLVKAIGMFFYFASTSEQEQLMAYEQPWKQRFGLIFCCAGDEAREMVDNETSKIFGDLFGQINLVPSDMIAAMICLNALERQQPYLSVIPRSVPQKLPVHHGRPLVPNDLVQKLSYFSKYYMGSYGMVVLSGHYPVTFCCRLCKQMPVSDKLQRVEDCCGCNSAAIKSYTHLPEEEIVFASYHNRLHHPAYFLAVDRAKQAIILAFRGTLSVQDAGTDLNVEPELADVPGLGPILCHKGFLLSTRNLMADLTKRGVLTQLLDVLYPTYRFVIVGHSLGAGVAAMTTMFLHSTYGSRIECYAYAPPSMFTKEDQTLIRHKIPTIVSCILWKDVVPRLNVVAMLRWRDDLVRALAHCRVPKWRVVVNPLLKILCCGRVGDIVHPLDANVFSVLRDGLPTGVTIENIPSATTQPDSLVHPPIPPAFVDVEQPNDDANGVPNAPTPAPTPSSPTLGFEFGNQPNGNGRGENTSPRSLGRPRSSRRLRRTSVGPRVLITGAKSTQTNVAFELWKSFLENYKDGHEAFHHLTSLQHTSCTIERKYAQLYPPGTIVHLLKKEKVKGQPIPLSQYIAVYADPEDFTHIVTSPNMLRDHMPWSLHDALKRLYRSSVTQQSTSTQPSYSGPPPSVWPSPADPALPSPPQQLFMSAPGVDTFAA